MVRRMPGWRHSWKLVSILIGHNDLCGKSCISTLQALGLSRCGTALRHTATALHCPCRRVAVEPGDFHRNVRAALGDLALALSLSSVLTNLQTSWLPSCPEPTWCSSPRPT